MGTWGRNFWILMSISSLLVGLLSLSLTGTAEAILVNLKLSGDLTTGGDVSAFEISPDGRYTVFLADARFNSVDELFSVPTNGGERTQLSHDLDSGIQVGGFVISPDSQSVVYWTSDADGYCTGIYAVLIAGGTPVELHGSVPAFKQMSAIAISGDSQYAVYSLYHYEYEVDPYEVLWAAPLDGGGASALTAEWCNHCSINFQVTPAGAQVVYIVAGLAGDRLYRGNMQGISEELAGSGIKDFTITPDGDWVVYTNLTDFPKVELFSIPIEGGSPHQLSGTMDSGRTVSDFQVAPNSEMVVYRSDELVLEQWELFSVPVNGSSERVRLLEPMVLLGDVMEYQITPNSLGVVYMADQLVNDRYDLGAVDMNGENTFWLNKEMVADGDVTDFAITPNSLGVVFMADKYVDETFELFSVSIIGTLLSRLSVDLPGGGDVLNFKIAPNSLGVVYRADQEANDVIELYAVPTVGGVPPTRLNTPLVPGGGVDTYAITPDSKGVLYLADQETVGMDELFATFDRLPFYLPLAMR